MKVKITKLEELKDALHPNNISVGFQKTYDVLPQFFKKPEIDSRFNCGSFSSSNVVEIISENIFKTLSSIYKWEIIEE